MFACKPFPTWTDQVGNVVGEISTSTVFLLTSLSFFSLSQSLANTIETVSVWTVLGAIGLNAILSAIRSVYNLVAVYKEYKRQVIRVGRNLSKIRPTEQNSVSFRSLAISRK